MKFGKLVLGQKRNQTSKRRGNSIEDYGRNQLRELAKKGLSFQIVVL